MSVEVSVIVATHQRKNLLLRTIDALAEQDAGGVEFEVVVSADSCTDGTREAVEACRASWPMDVRVVEHPRGNASATRNVGAAAARGAWLVFIDDDICPLPGFLSAHLLARREATVNLGYAKAVMSPEHDAHHAEVWRWWEDLFHRELSEVGHRFRFTDFLSGNFAMSAALFREVGGFDESFTRAWEDHEFGLRLIQHQVRLDYLPDAAGAHRFGTDLCTGLVRRREEGRAAVRLGRAHPHLRVGLFVGFLDGSHTRRMRFVLGLAQSKHCDRVTDRMLRFGASRTWVWRRRRAAACGLLRDVHYWQGVIEESGSLKSFTASLQDGQWPARLSVDAPAVDVDHLSAQSPRMLVEAFAPGADGLGVRVLLHGSLLFAIPPDPGAERLRVEHVLAAVGRVRAEQFLGRSVGALGSRESTREALAMLAETVDP